MQLRKQLKKATLTAAVAGLIGGGMAAPVQADVLATSILLIDGLQFNRAGTNTILDFNTDFASLTFTSTTDISAALTGFPTVGFSGGNPPNSPLDPAPVFTGPGPNPIPGNNTYPVLSGPPVGNYAAADSNELGAPIANVPDVSAGGVFATPADVNQAAYTGLTTSAGLGSSNANQNLNSSFVFSVAAPMMVDIVFDAVAYLEAYVDNTEVFPGFATAAFTQEFAIDDLTNGGRVFEWAPNGMAGGITGGTENLDPFTLNTTLSLNAPLPITVQQTNSGTPGTANTGSFSATTGMLTPGVLYQLSARSNTNADAQRVNIPEPGTLALLGLGLIGMGAVRRRKRVAA